MNSSRRVFVIHSVSALATGAAVIAAPIAFAQKPALVDPKDPTAAGLGYVADGKADKAKFPKFDATQNCANCAIYQGKATDSAGGCPLFAGKQVPAKAWCSAWVKKAA